MPLNSSRLIQHRQLFDRLGANYSDLMIMQPEQTPTYCFMCNTKQSPLYSFTGDSNVMWINVSICALMTPTVKTGTQAT